MAWGPFSLVRPTDAGLDRLLAEQAELPVSYPRIGMLRQKAAPGYQRHRSALPLGTGAATFDRAVTALGVWTAHTGAGFEIRPRKAPVEEGTTVVLVRRVAAVHVTVACRVVYLITGADRWGFAYGTLPHHAERGEESFVVERDSEGLVWFTVESLSHPAHQLARLCVPVTNAVQRAVTNRYLAAMQAATGLYG